MKWINNRRCFGKRRSICRWGILTITVSLVLGLSGCGAASKATSMFQLAEPESLSSGSPEVPEGRGTQMQRVAVDLVSALRDFGKSTEQLNGERQVSLDYPNNEFDVALLQAFQHFGYSIYESSPGQVAYRAEYRVETPHNSQTQKDQLGEQGAGTLRQGNNYRFELLTPTGTYVSRLYRWQDGYITPAGPMLELDEQGNVLRLIETESSHFL